MAVDLIIMDIPIWAYSRIYSKDLILHLKMRRVAFAMMIQSVRLNVDTISAYDVGPS